MTTTQTQQHRQLVNILWVLIAAITLGFAALITVLSVGTEFRWLGVFLVAFVVVFAIGMWIDGHE